MIYMVSMISMIYMISMLFLIYMIYRTEQANWAMIHATCLIWTKIKRGCGPSCEIMAGVWKKALNATVPWGFCPLPARGYRASDRCCCCLLLFVVCCCLLLFVVARCCSLLFVVGRCRCCRRRCRRRRCCVLLVPAGENRVIVFTVFENTQFLSVTCTSYVTSLGCGGWGC